jgi:predicted PhzF superfamily epimerase YddE/YHI9
LTVHDLDPSLPIQPVSTGIAFTVVPLARGEALCRLHHKFNFAAAVPYLTKFGGRNFYFVTRDTAALDGDATGAVWKRAASSTTAKIRRRDRPRAAARRGWCGMESHNPESR